MEKRQKYKKYHTRNITQESQEVSPLPANDLIAARNLQDSIIKTNVTHKSQKNPQKKHHLGMVSKITTGGHMPSILLVGHSQTVQTQVRHHRTRRLLIWVSTNCLQNVLLEFD